jgi:hypothetical protein
MHDRALPVIDVSRPFAVSGSPQCGQVVARELISR